MEWAVNTAQQKGPASKLLCNEKCLTVIKNLFYTFHSGFIGCDGGTLNGYMVLLGSQCRVDGDLVISLVTVRQAEVIILQLNVNIGQDELKVNKIKPTKVSTNYLSSFGILKNRFPTFNAVWDYLYCLHKRLNWSSGFKKWFKKK